MRVQIIEEQLPNVLNFICEYKKKVILFVLDKHQSCITENILRRLLTILRVAIEASELSALTVDTEVLRFLYGKTVGEFNL